MGLQDRQYYRDDDNSSPWSQAPTASQSIVVTLILINVGIFVLDMFSPEVRGANGQIRDLRWLNQILALHADVFQKPWLLWEFVTYGFAHASINSETSFFHVAGNMLVLFIFGRPVEQQLGRSEFVRFYLIAILLAGLGWVLLNYSSVGGERVGPAGPAEMIEQPIENNPSVGGELVGASGAVSAVVALFIFMFPHQTLLLFGIVPVKAWILGVIVVAMDLLRSLDPDSQIAWEAHLVGFAFGAAYFHFKWNLNWLQFDKLSKLFKPRPSLKIHREPANERIRQQADEILQKINDHGEKSLTSRERKTLKQYSEQIRKTRD